MVVHVSHYEADDLNVRTGKTEFLGCWILEAICGYTNEELYSSLTAVRRVAQGVLKHKKFKATPSFVRHTVLVKLRRKMAWRASTNKFMSGKATRLSS